MKRLFNYLLPRRLTYNDIAMILFAGLLMVSFILVK